MTSIAIYVEGGGDTAQQKAELRTGMDRLLAQSKEAARSRRMGWKLVPCGSRQHAYRAFINAVKTAGNSTLCVLLVDSEEIPAQERPAVSDETEDQRRQRESANARDRRDHLHHRDGWDLSSSEPEQLHLMVACMETWIVADPEGMAFYYGKGFRRGALPQRGDLEAEPKVELYDKLARATRDTSKGEYSAAANAKIRHASKLLATIDPRKVAARCPRFHTLSHWLERRILEARDH